MYPHDGTPVKSVAGSVPQRSTVLRTRRDNTAATWLGAKGLEDETRRYYYNSISLANRERQRDREWGWGGGA